MSDILFCDTDSAGFTSNLYERSKNYQASALISLIPDQLGLRDWSEHSPKVDFSKYKLIWLQLNPTTMFPPWYIFPAIIKRIVPDTTMIIEHEYWEKYYRAEMPHIIKKYLKRGDYLSVNSGMGREAVERNFDNPILYYHIGQPVVDEMFYHKPLPWKERNGIFVVNHTNPESLMVGKFEVGAATGLPMTVVNSEPFSDGSRLQALADAIGANATCFGRVNWSTYMDMMRRCRVALEMEYIGICRMAYECAKVSVPVVGTNLAEYRNNLYPKLTCEDDDFEGMVEKVLEVHNSIPPPTPLNRWSKKMIREYWSKETCHKRLMELFEEVGYDYQGSDSGL